MFAELLQRLQPLRGLPLWLRYALTVCIVLSCAAFRQALGNVDDPHSLPLYLLFIPSVILAAFLFNHGSGYLAVLMSALVGEFFFGGSLRDLGPDHPGDIVRFVSFLIIGLLVAGIVEALRTTVDQLGVRTQELEEMRRTLAAEYVQISQADQQKSLLLTDFNHRVKNHLQAVAGLASRGALMAQSTQDAREALEATAARLRVLGRVYDRLHLDQNNTVLDAKDFLGSLCGDLQSTVAALRPIAIRTNADPISLESGRAVSIGLMVNELVTNALKYAFPNGRPGEILVSFHCNDGGCCLEVQDDGVGLGATVRDGASGQRLVRGLAKQLGGDATWISPPGTRVLVSFPAECQP